MAPRRRLRQRRRPDAARAERVPRLFHGTARRLLPRSQARVVPDPARLRQRPRAGVQLDVHLERGPARRAADPRDRCRLHRRLGAEHAHRDDQHDQRGLRRDGAREGAARPPRHDALRGAQRHPAAAERLRGAVRRRRRRPRLHRVRIQLSRRRVDAAAGRPRQRLSADAGAPARLLALRDRGQFHHGPPQLRPRPAGPGR